MKALSTQSSFSSQAHFSPWPEPVMAYTFALSSYSLGFAKLARTEPTEPQVWGGQFSRGPYRNDLEAAREIATDRRSSKSDLLRVLKLNNSLSEIPKRYLTILVWQDIKGFDNLAVRWQRDKVAQFVVHKIYRTRSIRRSFLLFKFRFKAKRTVRISSNHPGLQEDSGLTCLFGTQHRKAMLQCGLRVHAASNTWGHWHLMPF